MTNTTLIKKVKFVRLGEDELIKSGDYQSWDGGEVLYSIDNSSVLRTPNHLGNRRSFWRIVDAINGFNGRFLELTTV